MRQRENGYLRKSIVNDKGIRASLRLVESSDSQVILEGEYPVDAIKDGFKSINDKVRLRIEIDHKFPEKLPTVIDLVGVIPRSLEYHTYEDGSFCLGSELRLKSAIADNPTVGNFLHKCVEPFLYSVLHKIRYEEIPYELEHGSEGLVDDYQELFGLEGNDAVWAAVSLLGMRKRIANKRPCPCRCGKRLGRCRLHFKLNTLRKLGSRKSYLEHLQLYLKPPIKRVRVL